MNEIQLFYLTIIIGIWILYLTISRICDAYETKYKAMAMANMKITDLSDNEEAREKLKEILQNQENKTGGDY